MKNEVQSGEEFPEKRCTQKPVAISDLTHKILETDKQYDLSKIVSAYQFAKQAHGSQTRSSGEPYIIHPLSVAMILVDLGMDTDTICVGLLHDVVEDTEYTLDDIRKKFGQDVAVLVDGVTKLNRIPIFDKEQQQAENVRKILLAMSHDIRVMIIKLADRIHNMRTLCFLPPAKQRRIALETMNVYAPIAHRLGIRTVKEELEDLSFYYLDSFAYAEIEHIMEIKKDEREAFISSIKERIRKRLAQEHFAKEPIIEGRVKSIYGIYKKVYMGHKSMDQIFDKYAVRVIVSTVAECYMVLGIVHDMFRPLPNRFKDYISTPKSNMYQSLHTTLIGSNGQPFEIQIRTFEMHRVAEYGIAAHWKYKEASDGKKPEVQEEEKLVWLRQILEWQRDMSDNKEFMNLLKNDLDLFSDSVYCFTPTGEVKNLPAGSTPIDFAYSIHSAVGNKMVGARVNGKLVTIDYKINNGDRIEIITSQNSKGPSRDWLNVVKSTQAKNKINQWFKNELKEDNILKGKDLLSGYCKARGINLASLQKQEYMDAIMRKYGFRDWDSVLAAIGHGALKEGQIVNKMQELYDRDHKKAMTNEEVLASIAENNAANAQSGANKPVLMKSKSGIVVKGIADLSVRFSKCCSPVPGDEIVGYVTRGRGISIHRTDCINIINLPEMERARLIDAEWQPEEEHAEKYLAEIKIYANNRNGLLADISKALTEKNIDIMSMNTRTNRQGLATLQTTFEISGREELNRIIDKIRGIESVIDIERTTG